LLANTNGGDYTEWQQDLWVGQSIDEIHEAATEYEERKNDKNDKLQ